MIIAIVGMPGSGKSTASEYIKQKGFGFVKFGNITLDILKEKGIEPTEKSEKEVREKMRKNHGMAAYAILSIPKIDEFSKQGNVVIDGLYSWEEYIELKKRYGDTLFLLSIQTPPNIRYSRLLKRPSDYPGMNRKFDSADIIKERDHSEIENLNKGGPISMADYTIVNTSTKENLLKQVDDIIKELT